MPPGMLAHGRSFFHRAAEQGLAVPAAGRGGSAGRSLPLKENHDLRGADRPHTRHRDAADDPPALGRIAVERVLQVLWTELAAPPAVFLRQHLIFHGLSTSSKRPTNNHFYPIAIPHLRCHLACTSPRLDYRRRLWRGLSSPLPQRR